MKKTISLIIIASMLIALFAGCSIGGQQGFEMSTKELTLTVGDSKALSIVPDSANKKVTWTSSNDSVATVETGTVKAKAVGTAVITATSESGQSTTCNVTVNGKPVRKVTVTPQVATVEAGKTVQLTATVSPSDAAATNLKWSPSDGTIAVVNDSGIVTGVKAGVVVINCEAEGGVKGSCTVTVTEKKKAESSQSSQSSKSDSGGSYTYVPHYRSGYVYRESDFVFPYSSTRQLSRGEIEATLSGMVGSPVSNSFAQDAINEIYARNGYVFKTDSIRSYYESKPWYWPDSSFTTSDFNSVEKYNISLLEEYD